MSFSRVLDNVRNGNFKEAKKQLYDVLECEKIELKDVEVVEKYYNVNKSPFVGYILYKTQCITGKYFEAYNTYMELINQGIRKKDITFNDVVKGATKEDLISICKDILVRLDGDDVIQSLLIDEVVDLIIPALWKYDDDEKYEIISNIASKLWFNDLKKSNCLYEFAYSCEKQNNDLAEKLYLKLIESEPANSAALNQIGLMYEQKDDIKKAEKYFTRAYEFSKGNTDYRKNLERVVLKK